MSKFRQVEKSRVLVIDDDPEIASLIQEGAEGCGYTVKCVNEFDDISSACMSFKPDIIFLDLRLKSHDGIEVIHSLSSANSNAAIFIVSGMDDSTLKAAAKVGKVNNLNIKGTISKPFLVKDIEKSLLNSDETSSRFSSSIWNEIMNSKGEFVTYYRPKMAIGTSGGATMAAVESVICWISHHGRVIYPDGFMPAIIKSKNMRLFSQTAFDKIMTDYKYWLDRSLEFDLSINLDQAMFKDIHLPDFLTKTVLEHGIPFSQVTFEMPFEIASSRSDVLLDVLTRIRIIGFGLTTLIESVDENTLTDLFSLPISEVKFSGNLLKGLHNDMNKEFEVLSMMSTAKKRGLKTCAVGIETSSLFYFAYDCGCSYGQGKYFSKLLEPRQVEDFAYGRAEHLNSSATFETAEETIKQDVS
jgi:EAL domain-containing protein (putative c-di-GMP-specific phosphodiesterase class I)/ActR/RegA family two-component response regulator